MVRFLVVLRAVVFFLAAVFFLGDRFAVVFFAVFFFVAAFFFVAVFFFGDRLAAFFVAVFLAAVFLVVAVFFLGDRLAVFLVTVFLAALRVVFFFAVAISVAPQSRVTINQFIRDLPLGHPCRGSQNILTLRIGPIFSILSQGEYCLSRHKNLNSLFILFVMQICSCARRGIKRRPSDSQRGS